MTNCKYPADAGGKVFQTSGGLIIDLSWRTCNLDLSEKGEHWLCDKLIYPTRAWMAFSTTCQGKVAFWDKFSGQKEEIHRSDNGNTPRRGSFTVSVTPMWYGEHREHKSSRQYRRGASSRMIKPKSCRALVTIVPLQPFICLAPRAL